VLVCAEHIVPRGNVGDDGGPCAIQALEHIDNSTEAHDGSMWDVDSLS